MYMHTEMLAGIGYRVCFANLTTEVFIFIHIQANGLDERFNQTLQI